MAIEPEKLRYMSVPEMREELPGMLPQEKQYCRMRVEALMHRCENDKDPKTAGVFRAFLDELGGPTPPPEMPPLPGVTEIPEPPPAEPTPRQDPVRTPRIDPDSTEAREEDFPVGEPEEAGEEVVEDDDGDEDDEPVVPEDHATDAAIRLAVEKGVDLVDVEYDGAGITKGDVQRHLKAVRGKQVRSDKRSKATK